MSSLDEILQVILSSILGVNFVQILSPVTMVSSISVYQMLAMTQTLFVRILTLNNGSNPDSIKAHALDIIKLSLKTLERSTTVISKIATSIATVIATATRNTVRKRKVNVSRLPGVCVCSVGEGAEGRHQGGELKKLHGQQKMAVNE